MNWRWYMGAGALAVSSTLALAAPESLLPPVFQQPAPAAAPSAAPSPAQPAPAPAPAPRPGANAPRAPSSPVVQQVPGEARSRAPEVPAARPGGYQLPPDFPTLAELEAMDEDELDVVLGLQPRFDIPPAARRAVRRVGLIAPAEGGFASGSLAGQPPALIRAAIRANRGPLVSRWGHILLRRALASRLDAPRGMNPVAFAAMRAALLNRMGEGMAARGLVQDIDSANYNRALADAAFTAYLATGDLLGMCPLAQVRGDLRDDAEWEMMQAICNSYAGDDRGARRRLDRALGTGEAPAIDVRLAQRFAGAAGEGRRAVNIEWDDVDALTPWRYSLARSLGVELPDALRADAGARYDLSDVLIPAVPIAQRIEAADRAARRGVLSAAAVVDLYSQLYAGGSDAEAERQTAQTLRQAYVGADPTARIAAIEALWQGGEADYGRQVLTAYAAARLPVSEALLDTAPGILASMLTAGLDRNAQRWASVVPEGSPAWGLLVFAQAQGAGDISGSAVDAFSGEDRSDDRRKSQFLLAGLAGLGRLDANTAADLGGELGVDLDRRSAWSVRIDRAGGLAQRRARGAARRARDAGRELGPDDAAPPLPYRPRARPGGSQRRGTDDRRGGGRARLKLVLPRFPSRRVIPPGLAIAPGWRAGRSAPPSTSSWSCSPPSAARRPTRLPPTAAISRAARR